jgi:hypothetical protein
VKYGTDAYDQWSADELIALAKGAPAGGLEGGSASSRAWTGTNQIINSIKQKEISRPDEHDDFWL